MLKNILVKLTNFFLDDFKKELKERDKIIADMYCDLQRNINTQSLLIKQLIEKKEEDRIKEEWKICPNCKSRHTCIDACPFCLQEVYPCLSLN